MRITSLRLHCFKRFDRLSVVLRPLSCLVGANNSGKTTLLQALALFDFCKEHCLSGSNGRLELKARSVAAEELYVLPVPSPQDLWTDRKAAERGKPRAIAIELRFDSGLEVTATVKLSFNRFGLALRSSDASQEALRALRAFRIAYLPVFSAFLPQEERRTRAAVEDELARGRVNLVVRNLLVDLKNEGRAELLVETLRHLFPELEGLDVAFDEENDRYISIEYRERGRPRAFDLFSAGSGFQQFLYLFGFISLRQPSLVLLDEPDVHLHGHLQRALVEELERLVAGGKQMLLATHSRDLLERVEPQDIIFLDAGEARPLRIEHEVYDTLDALGSLEASQLPALQRYRRLLVVENRTDFELLASFLASCLGAKTWRLLERRVAVCCAEGNPWRHDIRRLRSQLAQALTLTGAPLEVFVVADRDYYPSRSELVASVAQPHVAWHVWERAEIENYLLVPEAIVRLLGGGADQVAIWEVGLRKELGRLLDAARRDARHRLVEGFTEHSRRLRKGWDASRISREAEAYLDAHWERAREGLADAKESVLPALKRWCQENRLESFSNRRLAETLTAAELPGEVRTLARSIARFADLAVDEDPATAQS